MPSDVIQARSSLSAGEIARVFQNALGGRRVVFGKIDQDDDPFADVLRQPVFSAVASHDKNIGSWAVQIYVYDEDDSRLVEVHAVYHSGFSRAMSGTKNTYSKAASVKNARAVVEALRDSDPSAALV
ncbi:MULTISPECIES: hypothetical protein [Amycolatopsis]|uniref:Uncharacterized protein n=1 Tax=Amycolatopsis dendrobii TaxID=2760662 RepID=A0A7W3W719_9PSEU|nr:MULTISPECIES: hypothetical protein [Amycolatopsis]MBB1160044.1 hypothetical protein [Amycolatopsis dendrobii]UKD55326.1 hypothetical protein L3Q65_47030 [Amycolatopsis sp. FU40]